MNIEEYRDYCLSLGIDVEEKLPFTMFKSGENSHLQRKLYASVASSLPNCEKRQNENNREI